jgi:hypothetical protein
VKVRTPRIYEAKLEAFADYPGELLSGSLTCCVCGGAVARVTGKSGGYSSCIGATRQKCENRLLARRTLAERIILAVLKWRGRGAGAATGQ